MVSEQPPADGRSGPGSAEAAGGRVEGLAAGTGAAAETARTAESKSTLAACPFLAAAAAGSTDSDGAHCLAGDFPVRLSTLQVELVCRTDLQAHCPRFLTATRRGRRPPDRPELAAQEPPVELPVAVLARSLGRGSTLRRMPRARLGALVLLGVAVVIAAAGSLRPGGLTIAGLAASPEPSATPTPIPSPSPSPLLSPSPNESPTPEPSPALSPSPEASPSPSLAAEPSASPSPQPSPTSDRYALLEPCPDRPDCYIYTVRQGDNLWSIGNYFGVPLATIYDLNPWARTTGLRPGQKLILPPPTR